MTGSRASLAQFKGLTSKLIGRFAWSAVEATRERYGRNTPLTRYSAELIVPEDTRDENRRHEGDCNSIRYDGS